jgi:hypothetical protein
MAIAKRMTGKYRSLSDIVNQDNKINYNDIVSLFRDDTRFSPAYAGGSKGKRGLEKDAIGWGITDIFNTLANWMGTHNDMCERMYVYGQATSKCKFVAISGPKDNEGGIPVVYIQFDKDQMSFFYDKREYYDNGSDYMAWKDSSDMKSMVRSLYEILE